MQGSFIYHTAHMYKYRYILSVYTKEKLVIVVF